MTAVVELRRFVGERLLACASAWHEFEGTRAGDPNDTWMTFGSETVNLRGAGNGQDLVVRVEPVEAGFDMQEYGRVVVEQGTPLVLGRCVGEILRGVRVLGYEPWGDEAVGLVLDFSSTSVAFFNIADETQVLTWSPEAVEKFSMVGVSG